MRPTRALTGALLVIGATAALIAMPAPRAAAQGDPGKVLVVSVPRLVWQDVVDQRPPALSAFLEDAAYGSLSVRAIGPRTDLGEGYVTIGAGNRARVDPRRAGDAFGADEQVGNTTGADLYRAVTASDPGDARVLSLAITEAPGGRPPAPVRLGARGLGPGRDRRREAGGRDRQRRRRPTGRHRQGPPGGGAGRDGRSRARARRRRRRLADGARPGGAGGRRTDPDAVLSAFDEAWATDDVVLVELSDLERAEP